MQVYGHALVAIDDIVYCLGGLTDQPEHQLLDTVDRIYKLQFKNTDGYEWLETNIYLKMPRSDFNAVQVPAKHIKDNFASSYVKGLTDLKSNSFSYLVY